MTYKEYHKKYLPTGQEFTEKFTEAQFKEAGCFGWNGEMPELHSLRLINKWNRIGSVRGTRYFWLED